MFRYSFLISLYSLSLCLSVTGLTFDQKSNANVFPTSTRDALVQKSKLLNPTRYSSAGWSNRAATALTPIHPDGIYTADRPFYWNNIDVSCRCTIIELPADGATKKKLWVHSPVTLDGPLTTALQNLVGSAEAVEYYVVSPNYEHLKFAPEWQARFSNQAKMIACPGLPQRMPDMEWAVEIPNHYRPVSWTGSPSLAAAVDLPWDTNILQPLHIDCEVNPFTGKPFFNEVIFYHTPTKALIVTDLFWNYPAADAPNAQFGRNDEWELAPSQPVPFGSKLWKFGMDKVYGPFFRNFMISNPTAYQDIVHHILNVWDVEMVIPAHGDILRGKEFIQGVLKKHFQVS